MDSMNNPKEVLELLFQENPQPMWIYKTEDWRILFVNKTATDVYGYSQEEFLTMTIKELRPEEEQKRFHGIVNEVRVNKSQRWDFRHQDKNGKVFWVQICSYPLRYNDTDCRLVLVLDLQDILDYRSTINKQASDLQKILDNSIDVICSFDAEGRFVQCSRASEKVWGYSPDELIGRPYLDFVCNEDKADSIKISQDLMLGLEVRNFQNRYIKKDGSLIPLVWSARWDNTEQTMFSIARDATEKMSAEIKAREQSQRIVSILESITDGFFTIDDNWLVTHWNSEAERILQMPRQKILNKRLWEVFDESVLVRFYPQYLEALQKMVPIHFEEYSSRLDIWLDVTAYPSSGGFSVYFKDVTERIKTQALIKESKERYDMLSRATNDIIWDWNILSDTVDWGMAFEKTLGYERCEEYSNGKWWISNLHPEDRDRVAERMAQFIRQAGTWSEEYRFKCADGSYKNFLDRGFVICNEDGECVRVIGSMQDITQLKQKEWEIFKHNQKMLKIAHTNSHHVRKPLANILGLVNLLLQAHEEDREDLLKMLKESSDELDSVLKGVAEITSSLQD